MKTLIELFDVRASENVIGPETFKPDKVVYICSPEQARDTKRQAKLREYYKYRGLDTYLQFVESSMYKADSIYEQLQVIADKNPDCAIDISGGTEAALFAAGMFCQESGVPAFTYSRKRNRFYNISNAEFAHDLPCELVYKVEDFFRMAGGSMRKGRVDNAILGKYMDKYEGFFNVFREHRRRWNDIVTFMQRISQTGPDQPIPLHVKGDYIQKGEHGHRIKADETALRSFQAIGFIQNLRILPDESVEFDFADHQVRTWLRDVGSVLELYMYKKCLDAGIFDDVVSSAIVDWDGTVGRDSISNEIDVAATRGTVPLFISCKACEISTYALNELAILKERFGGKGAKAAIVSTELCNAAARHRAAQLGISVIDKEELENGHAVERLKIIMKVSSAKAYE